MDQNEIVETDEFVEMDEETVEDAVYDAHHRINAVIQLLIEKNIITEAELEAVGEKLEEEESDEETN